MKIFVIIIAMLFGLFLSYTFLLNRDTKLDSGAVIDKILVEKNKREMHVYRNGVCLKTYKIALGSNPIGHKECEGDGKTPEGIYTINDKNPNSAYYKNLGISYPNEKDIAHADSLGLSPGGAIKIHGIKNGLGAFAKAIQLKDWTAGCIAVTDEEMEELFNAVPIGTEIEILP
jgi:murein L,D-transpeptidase YafK